MNGKKARQLRRMAAAGDNDKDSKPIPTRVKNSLGQMKIMHVISPDTERAALITSKKVYKNMRRSGQLHALEQKQAMATGRKEN